VKKDIHPKYYSEAKVICACGNTWTTGSTQAVIHTEMCSVCHPFFTGEQRIVDTAGQVDRFQKRKERADKLAQQNADRKTARDKQGQAIFEFVPEAKSKAAAEPAPVAEPPVAAAEQVVAPEAAPVEAKPRAKKPKAEAAPEAAPAEAKPRAKKPKAEVVPEAAPVKAKPRAKKPKAEVVPEAAPVKAKPSAKKPKAEAASPAEPAAE